MYLTSKSGRRSKGYEALLLPEGGMLRPAELIEDELILALPVVPMDPSGDPVDLTWSPAIASLEAVKFEEEPHKNPFAVLADFKRHIQRD